MQAAGSSPRVRGKPLGARASRPRAGLIPACAGKTPAERRRTTTTRAHPRVCGENASIGSRLNFVAGSSPRVRGKLRERRWPPAGAGLIPACAGKTDSHPLPPRPRWAHPRVCGENAYPVVAVRLWSGSSPRVRGKRPPLDHVPHEARLIPACAGKTRADAPAGPGSPAHPRVCGENAPALTGGEQCGGSSPRVRGKLTQRALGARIGRLIPACAGKTLPDLGFYRSGRSDLGNPRAFRLF